MILMNQLNMENDFKVLEVDGEGLVLLFPVTRMGDVALEKWNNIVELCNQSQINALVVIDKTYNKEASRFFSGNIFQGNIKCYVISRPSTEAIYDSQKYIKISTNSWIIQLHDDDEWEGKLTLPTSKSQMVAFQVPFFVGSKNNCTKSHKYDNLPARINFTLIPSVIWNNFTHFIESQSGHIAGSADATLNMIVRDLCLMLHCGDFRYYYNIRHWKNNRNSKAHLSNLSREDGWEQYSSPEIAVINRTIDNLAALSFFSEFYNIDKLSVAMTREMAGFKMSAHKKALLYVQLMLSKLGFHKFERQLLIQLIRSSQVKTIHDLISWLGNFSTLPLLEKRISFWATELAKLQKTLIKEIE